MSGIAPGGGGTGGGITPNPPINVSTWSSYPAITDLNIDSNNINNVNILNAIQVNTSSHTTGNLDVSGNLTVDNQTNLNGDLDVSGNLTVGGNVSANIPLSQVLTAGDDAGGLNITNVGTLTTTDLNVSNEINTNSIKSENLGLTVLNNALPDIIIGSSDNTKSYGLNANVNNTTDFGLAITGKNASGTYEQIAVFGSSQSTAGRTLNMSNNRITDTAEPINPQDVATKNYVDNLGLPTLDEVLTAGNSASVQGINNAGNYYNNNSFYIAITGGLVSYSNTIGISANTPGFGNSINLNSDGAGTTRINGQFLNFNASSVDFNFSGLGNIFSIDGEVFYERNVPVENSKFSVPQLEIRKTNNQATDSGTGVAMSKYLLTGADVNQVGAGGRNWMISKVFSGGAEIARMRIALDKGYFATEQHPVRIPTNYDESYYGLILSSKGEYINKPTVSEAHIYCEVSTTEKDKNVYGIYSNYDFPVMTGETADEQIYSLYIPQKTPESKIGYSNSGGEGQIWVCNINGNIEKGDYICSSSIPGLGMKQDDDLKHNYTIFKSAFDCDFTNQTSTYPEHIIDTSNNREWRDPEDHSKGFKYEMKTYENKSYNLTIYNDRYEIEGVLTFPYNFQTNKPELVGQTFKAMLLGGVYCN